MDHYKEIIRNIAAKPIELIDLSNPFYIKLYFKDQTENFSKFDMLLRTFLMTLDKLSSVQIIDPNDARIPCAIPEKIENYELLGYKSGEIWEFSDVQNNHFVIQFS